MKLPNKHSVTTARDYLVAAHGHLTAAKHLEPLIYREDEKSYNSVFTAFYNVLGFSVELYLKSFLCANGIKSDELSKYPYGHHLNRLLDESEKRGLTYHKDGLKVTVNLLNDNHSHYDYRYLSMEAKIQMFMPGEPIKIVFAVMDELDANVRRIAEID